ncbi:FMN-binding protein [Pedococcus sp. KACC 23699]|uniref:FMN-binding protein n=1 Tax=Pedococcus sp. KACC 23699 TaxID=3149228 RepID=A0AAU7JR76_9MICO
MRRITLWSLSTLTTLVLLFSYHTSTSSRSSSVAAPVIAQAATPGAVATPKATSPSGTSTSGSSSSSTPSGGSSSSSSSPSQSSAAKTYAGDAIGTQYGDVQVQITVKGGKITASQVLQVPWNDNRDQEINSYAVPILNQEAVSSQSANIDMVSGATFTSDGYIQSLQSAIDQAHL